MSGLNLEVIIVKTKVCIKIENETKTMFGAILEKSVKFAKMIHSSK